MAKCSECGYLAVRNIDWRNLVEVELDYRNTGECPKRIDYSPPYEIYDVPRCFKQASNLWDEIQNLQGSDSEKIRSVIQKDRPCDEFTEWHQGFTPREHQEMVDREKQLEWQAGREDKDREWRREESKENRKWRFREFIVAVVALAVIVLASIIGALIQRGGQPTININTTTNPPNVTVQQK